MTISTMIRSGKARTGFPARQKHIIGQIDIDAPVLSVAVTSESAYRVPAGAREIRVLSGGAWVSYHGADHVIYHNEALPLDPSDAHEAIVTALNAQDTVIGVVSGE